MGFEGLTRKQTATGCIVTFDNHLWQRVNRPGMKPASSQPEQSKVEVGEVVEMSTPSSLRKLPKTRHHSGVGG